MSGGVINYFDEHLIWTLLLQGCFFVICVIIGFSYLMGRVRKCAEAFTPTTDDNELEHLYDGLAVAFDKLISLINGGDFLDEQQKSRRKRSEDKDSNSAKFIRAKIQPFLTLSYTLLMIFMVLFAAGILCNRVADKYLDKHPRWHLGLKYSWLEFMPAKSQNDTVASAYNKKLLEDSDKMLKIRAFNKVYKEYDRLPEDKKLQLYYDMKHKMLADTRWANFLDSTQQLVNYSQVLVFSFLALYFLLTITLIINIAAVIKIQLNNPKDANAEVVQLRKKKGVRFAIASAVIVTFWIARVFVYPAPGVWLFGILCPLALVLAQYLLGIKDSTRILVNFIFISGAFLLYQASGIAWRDNEKEFDLKVFGVTKVTSPNLYINELELLDDKKIVSPKLLQLAKDSLTLDSINLKRAKLQIEKRKLDGNTSNTIQKNNDNK